MRILLLGKNGQVGRALQETLAPLGELVALGRSEAPLERLDELDGTVRDLKPDIIVNAAAYTAVDRAEDEPETARRINGEAVAVLAAAAARSGCWLLHYSTDYVFDGRKPAPYVETDPAEPLSVYGRTKLAGDEAIGASGCRHLIFRVSWVYAAGHANFPSAMLKLAGTRTGLSVVGDQIGAPTSAGLIARVSAAALRRVTGSKASDELSGLYNLAAGGAVSRADLARFVVEEARRAGAVLALDPTAIAAIATTDYPLPAERPLNSRLDTGKLRTAFGVELTPWQDDMRRWVTTTVEGMAA